MRYSVYKFLRGVSASILEGVTYVKEKPASINILADCTEGLVSIKDALIMNQENNLEEIDFAWGKINEIADCIENNKEYSNKLDELLELVKKVDEYCKTKIKYKFRIVFFAELGSKWDSMDSVYWAYKNREDCDVAVVLAPIYRAIKLPNGEVRSDVIYRDYLTDMGIKHILFKDYDIKKDMPDIVFTSQPYESVTPEQFWAENIVPYTRLVYLPYFTSGAVEMDEQKYEQCQMPIHKLAWRVVCQSEKAKEIYSKYFIDGGKKLVSMGLPKWDYVVNMQDRNVEMPKEWNKLKGKKVILRNFHYNISNLKSFIEALYKMIEMVDGKDIAFLIRFHPMMETMFKVYYTEFMDEWQKVKEDIDRSKNVVIDRNEGYDAALKFSDIFLTFRTSLIFQYLLTKKPVVIMFGNDLENVKKNDDKEDVFIKTTKFYPTKNIETGYELCKKILLEGDSEYKERMELINEYLPNSDGKIGERIASELINEILKEDNII